MKTISKLKKELDKWFSLFIRLRNASKDGIVKCFTCNKTGHYKKYTFGKLIDVRIGEGKSEEIQELSRTTVKYMRHEYEDMIKFYKEKVNAIKTD